MAKVSRLDPALSAQRTGLIMFDALNGYLHPGDPAKVAFLAERNILPNMQRLIAGARKVGMTTFYPSGAHAEDGSDTVSRLTDTDMDLGAGETLRTRSSRDFSRAPQTRMLLPKSLRFPATW
jgi:nicotinamidase-related amidase